MNTEIKVYYEDTDASKKEFGDLDWTSMFNFIKNK